MGLRKFGLTSFCVCERALLDDPSTQPSLAIHPPHPVHPPTPSCLFAGLPRQGLLLRSCWDQRALLLRPSWRDPTNPNCSANQRFPLRRPVRYGVSARRGSAPGSPARMCVNVCMRVCVCVRLFREGYVTLNDSEILQTLTTCVRACVCVCCC